MIIFFFFALIETSSKTRLFDLDQGSITHDTGNCKLSLDAWGHILNFRYPRMSANWLFFGGIAVGNSRTYVADAFSPESDFQIVDSFRRVNRLRLQEYKLIIDDSNHPTPKNIEIEQYSVASPFPAYDDGVIIEYIFTNKGTTPIENLYAGIFMDWDLGTPNPNRAGTDTIRRTPWMRQRATDNPTVGTTILYPYSWANLYCTDPDSFVYPFPEMPDSIKYKIISGLMRKYASTRDYDWSTCASVGPFTLAPHAR